MFRALYPSLRMGEVCRLCRGNAYVVIGRYRCQLCKKSNDDYKAADLEREVTEFKWLHDTWLTVKKYNQITTGIKKLDNVLELLFGKPHDRYWRDYKRQPVKNDSPFVVLRTVVL